MPDFSVGGDRCMSVYEEILNLIGAPPPGYDILVWIAAALFFLYILASIISIFASLMRFTSGR